MISVYWCYAPVNSLIGINRILFAACIQWERGCLLRR